MIYLFTDGSCSTKTEHGAWGALIVTPQKRQTIYGSAYPTTISRCELLPIIEGLRVIYYDILKKREGIVVTVVSDSEYTVQTLGGHFEPNKNRDLWEAVKFFQGVMKVEFVWRARNTNPYMEYCDALAHGARVAGLEYHDALLRVKPPENEITPNMT